MGFTGVVGLGRITGARAAGSGGGRPRSSCGSRGAFAVGGIDDEPVRADGEPVDRAPDTVQGISVPEVSASGSSNAEGRLAGVVGTDRPAELGAAGRRARRGARR